MDLAGFRKLPILGILRGIRPEDVIPLVKTIEESGLSAMEITMNTAGAAELIKQAVKASGKKLAIGAGTVLGLKDLKAALGAGATFIVTPVLINEVMQYCRKRKIPVFAGALTPSEIYQAWLAGAAMVKVFPAKFFGPEYFQEIKGPFNQIELLACGGVTAQNMGEYFKNGASAISFGASVFKKEWLAKKDYQSIGQGIREYVQGYAGIKTPSCKG